MVSISGCGPLDPGSNPGIAKIFKLIHVKKYTRDAVWFEHEEPLQRVLCPVPHWLNYVS